MKFSKKSFSIKNYIQFSTILTLIIGSCASIVSPQGGPRDLTPPKLLTIEPKNKTTNFTAKKIVIEFDEYVQLKDQYKEITVSPEMETPPEISAKKKEIVIKLIDTLQKNTTYSINFGKSITDVHESNEMKNFKYVFSTGNYIDSLKISGSVLFEGDTTIVKDVQVGLYPDSLKWVAKRKPLLYTLSAEKGKFEITNVKEGKYRIFAIKDVNNNKLFDEEEMLGFLPNPIYLKKDTSGITLTLAHQFPEKLKVTESKYYEGKIRLKLNGKTDTLLAKALYPKEFENNILVDRNEKDSIVLWLPTQKFDSTKIVVSTEKQIIDTITIRNYNQEAKFSPIKITDNLKGESLMPGEKYKLIFSRPLKDPNLSNIEVLQDSVKLRNYKVRLNPQNAREYFIEYPWDSTKHYEVNIKENQFKDNFGKLNLKFQRRFKQDSVGNYGILDINLTIPEGKQYLIKLVNSSNEEVKKLVAPKTGIYKLTILPPDKYKIIFTEDVNKNGKADLGDYRKNLQPEKNTYYPDEISVRINWELEIKYKLE
ncbi:Ig-like domain-containing protein [Solitalea koreensis]|uniref:Ig-like domain-containing protein n=1 Tax=Solitalea koreensis TaxID=543615 RepID=A0A521C3E6_9SPHI|nr:Ig-like domain-containing protein [Solitalea koreensis]SMO53331.1 Ig-like domain-containing protein [Solitalea koreensis]